MDDARFGVRHVHGQHKTEIGLFQNLHSSPFSQKADLTFVPHSDATRLRAQIIHHQKGSKTTMKRLNESSGGGQGVSSNVGTQQEVVHGLATRSTRPKLVPAMIVPAARDHVLERQARQAHGAGLSPVEASSLRAEHHMDAVERLPTFEAELAAKYAAVDLMSVVNEDYEPAPHLYSVNSSQCLNSCAAQSSSLRDIFTVCVSVYGFRVLTAWLTPVLCLCLSLQSLHRLRGEAALKKSAADTHLARALGLPRAHFGAWSAATPNEVFKREGLVYVARAGKTFALPRHYPHSCISDYVLNVKAYQDGDGMEFVRWEEFNGQEGAAPVSRWTQIRRVFSMKLVFVWLKQQGGALPPVRLTSVDIATRTTVAIRARMDTFALARDLGWTEVTVLHLDGDGTDRSELSKRNLMNKVFKPEGAHSDLQWITRGVYTHNGHTPLVAIDTVRGKPSMIYVPSILPLVHMLEPRNKAAISKMVKACADGPHALLAMKLGDTTGTDLGTIMNQIGRAGTLASANQHNGAGHIQVSVQAHQHNAKGPNASGAFEGKVYATAARPGTIRAVATRDTLADVDMACASKAQVEGLEAKAILISRMFSPLVKLGRKTEELFPRCVVSSPLAAAKSAYRHGFDKSYEATNAFVDGRPSLRNSLCHFTNKQTKTLNYSADIRDSLNSHQGLFMHTDSTNARNVMNNVFTLGCEMTGFEQLWPAWGLRVKTVPFSLSSATSFDMAHMVAGGTGIRFTHVDTDHMWATEGVDGNGSRVVVDLPGAPLSPVNPSLFEADGRTPRPKG